MDHKRKAHESCGTTRNSHDSWELRVMGHGRKAYRRSLNGVGDHPEPSCFMGVTGDLLEKSGSGQYS